MIKVVIVDDHPIVRLGVRQVVEKESDMTVTGEASSAAEFFSLIKKVECDVVTLDIRLPDRNGLDVMSQLSTKRPDLKVLILSMNPEEQYAMRFFKVGAAGYMMKESAVAELANAIRKVHSGGVYVSGSLAEKLVHNRHTVVKPIHETLSNRELQIFCLIAGGKALRQIAAELCLSEKTVSTYRRRILDKMNLKSNADLTRYALNHKLI